jgi:hypothetical protein
VRGAKTRNNPSSVHKELFLTVLTTRQTFNCPNRQCHNRDIQFPVSVSCPVISGFLFISEATPFWPNNVSVSPRVLQCHFIFVRVNHVQTPNSCALLTPIGTHYFVVRCPILKTRAIAAVSALDADLFDYHGTGFPALYKPGSLASYWMYGIKASGLNPKYSLIALNF